MKAPAHERPPPAKRSPLAGGLWFQQAFVGPILAGDKRETIRPGTPESCRFRPGDWLRASVGPRRPFALLVVTAVEAVTFANLPPERQRGLRRLYGAGASEAALLRITFEACAWPA